MKPSYLTVDFAKLCRDIIKIDGISSAGIINTEGQVLATESRQDVAQLLVAEESLLLLSQALLRWNMRLTMQEKLGKPLFSLVEYEQIKSATIPRFDSNGSLEYLAKLLLEKNLENEKHVILKKVIPLLQKN
jgi:hypothetical protein